MEEINNLLRQKSIFTNGDGLRERIQDRVILVTGAGGSIGSELCRQIMPYKPRHLILLGHGEHSIFTVASDLQARDPDLPIARVIANVQDCNRVEKVFFEFRPEIVFHAAAHKHVPLMEENISEGIINNVLGTLNTVRAAVNSGAHTFVLISTDKAVNPISVMGATKRIAELIVGEAAKNTGRCFCSVRFGNVIGSRGSVVGIFQEQIARGGPVTVTHPEMERHFMTTHDAVHLVLQASKLGKGGEVFTLDMGNRLKIVDIARAMIESQGHRVDRDIEIVFTGARAGERLTEEMFRDGSYERTSHPKVLVLRNGASFSFQGEKRPTVPSLNATLKILIEAARQDDRAKIRQLLKEIVSESNTRQMALTEAAALTKTAETGTAF